MATYLSNLTDSHLQFLLDTSSSYSEILLSIGYKSNGGYISKNIKNRVKNLDISKFEENRRNAGFNKNPKSNEELLIENGKYNDRSSVKKRILNLREYKCEICNLCEWLKSPITLHLDHINGINTDNRLENLRLICPNCHSQTETYAGKNRTPSQKIFYCGCGKLKSRYSECCQKCDDKTKIKWPSTENMERMIWEYPTTKIATNLGVSDTAVKNFCKRNNIKKPGRGYWTKLKGV